VKVLNVTKFKATCLAVLDEVEERGESVAITRRGRAVAVLAPLKRKPYKSPEGMFSGRIEVADDILSTDLSGLWESNSRKDSV